MWDSDGQVLKTDHGLIHLILPGQRMAIATHRGFPLSGGEVVDRITVEIRTGALIEHQPVSSYFATEDVTFHFSGSRDTVSGTTGTISNPFDTVYHLMINDRRDKALIMMLLDTGMRRAELAGLNLEELDLENNVAVVMGKNRRPRVCPFGRRTALALDRYLRSRIKHRYSDKPELWLGHSGPIKANGINQIVTKRAEQAGLPHIKPHQFRHSYAHNWLVSGGNESDLMRLAG